MWKDSAQNQSDEFEADGPVFLLTAGKQAPSFVYKSHVKRVYLFSLL